MPTGLTLAFVTPRFSEAGTIGGAETLLKNLAVHAADRGCKVTVLTTCAEDHFTWRNTLPPGERQVGALTVHYFPVDEERDLETFLRVQTAISRHAPVSSEDEEAWMQNNVNSRALYDHLKVHGDAYDAIVLGPYLFSLVYYAAQIHPHKSLLVPCLHDEPFAYLGLMKTLFAAVAGFMFNSEPEYDLARRLFNVEPARSTVVGMGLTPFETNGHTKRDQPPYLLYSGRREPMKGTPLMLDYLDAFRQRTGIDLKLVLTGSGGFEPPDQLAPHITDRGFVTEEEKHTLMAGALAFCHPSVNESFGIVLLESWLARTPALVHAGSNVLRWQCMRSNAGLWFRSYPEFEEELLLLLNDEPLRKRMGEAGRAYVLHEYAWERVGARMMEALNKTLAAGRA